jgi:hypothetical protein
MVNSGGSGTDDDLDVEFLRHIKAEIQGLADEIADLRSAANGKHCTDRLIAVHRRTIRRLRGHLPSIPS